MARSALLLGLLLASLARGQETSTPNVLLIISDDQGYGDYGFTGHPVIQTPHLDRLAERSLVFERGYVASPLCRPSLASIATGLHAHQHGVLANDVDPRKRAESNVPVVRAFQSHPSLMTVLGEAGYRTHQSGKWWEGSFADGGFSHGMTHGDPARRGRHGDEGLKIGRQGLAPITEFIDEALAAEDPFFLWYAPLLPHRPHNPPERLLEDYLKLGMPEPIATYRAMCTWFDETCGALLGYLDEKDLTDDTLVVLVTDNGWLQMPDTSGFAPRSTSPRRSWPSGRRPFECGWLRPATRCSTSWPSE